MSPLQDLSFAVTRYLAHFQKFYPGILEWFPGVKEELESRRRCMFAVWDGSDVLGLVITKNGHSGKLCHISVSPAVRNRGLGWSLVQLALRDMILRGAREIWLTTGEEVYRRHAPFFSAAGFKVVDWQARRYRRDVSEVVWRLDVDTELFDLGETALRCPRSVLPPRIRAGPRSADRRRCNIAISPAFGAGINRLAGP